MTEREEWQIKYGQALSFLKEEEGKMLQEDIFVKSEGLYNWFEKTSRAAVKISPVCGGGHLALWVCDKLDEMENGQLILQDIINYAGKMGIKSDVNTKSLRYQASVCVSMFLDERLKKYQTEV